MLTQRDGRPNLHPLSWGYDFMRSAVWSPNGRWVAALAGPDYLTDYPVVVSPDGRTHHTLASWQCGLPNEFDLVWSPDGRLACISDDPHVSGARRLCASEPSAFQACENVSLPPAVGLAGTGSVWSADGATLWITAIQDYANGDVSDDPDLFVVSAATGSLVQTMPFSFEGGIYLPTWVPGQPPHQQVLSYEVGLADIDGPGQLVMSEVTRDASGHFVLGQRTVLASGQVQDEYAWSPSGRWVAVRHVDPEAGDKIYLVNAADPSLTVDVTHAEDVGQMFDPVWSPDGQTLVVFSTLDERPYAIDIGRYLASKGLQP